MSLFLYILGNYNFMIPESWQNHVTFSFHFTWILKLTAFLFNSTVSLFTVIRSDQFSHSVVSDSLQPHESQHARPPCPSSTPGVHSDSRPLSQWCHPAISSSFVPFSSCPQSLPASESLFQWTEDEGLEGRCSVGREGGQRCRRRQWWRGWRKAHRWFHCERLCKVRHMYRCDQGI